MKSGVKTVVDTADIIDKDKDIYINLFNIYIKRIQNKPFFEKIKVISECQNDERYKELPAEYQEKMFTDLMHQAESHKKGETYEE